MKKSVVFAIFCFCLFTVSYSQSVKQESVRELIKVMKMDSMIIKNIDAMIPAMVSQMQSQLKDDAAKAKSEKIIMLTMETTKEMSPKLTEMISNIYMKYFDESDIKAFLDFYKSPAGQKYIQLTPQITKEMMGEMMQSYVPEMQKVLKAKMDKLNLK